MEGSTHTGGLPVHCKLSTIIRVIAMGTACVCVYIYVCLFFLFFLKPFHSDVVLPHTQTHKGTLLGSESSESKSSVSEHLQSKHLCVIVNILLTYFPFCRIKTDLHSAALKG